MARPDRVYVSIAAVGAFVSTLAFTITPFYRFQVAGLDDLELVLAGTVMEAAVFCFEIPTGVVADLWSRKWSVDRRPRRHRRRPADRGVVAVGRRRARRPGRVGDRLHVHERGHGRLAHRRARRARPGGAHHAVPARQPLRLGGRARRRARWRSCSAGVSLRLPIVARRRHLGRCSALWLVAAMAEAHFEPVADRRHVARLRAAPRATASGRSGRARCSSCSPSPSSSPAVPARPTTGTPRSTSSSTSVRRRGRAGPG